jgi:hypothetical protein
MEIVVSENMTELLEVKIIMVRNLVYVYSKNITEIFIKKVKPTKFKSF